MPGVRPGRRVTSSPISEIKKVIDPVQITVTEADFSHNQVEVGTTAVQLTGTSTPCKKGVLVKALSTNGDKVYVGKSGVTTGTGYELIAEDTVTIEVDNVNKVYAIAGAASQKVSWIGV